MCGHRVQVGLHRASAPPNHRRNVYDDNFCRTIRSRHQHVYELTQRSMTFCNVAFTQKLVPWRRERTYMPPQCIEPFRIRVIKLPKEIAMRNLSTLRKALIASGAMMAFAALPLTQAMAQDTSNSSAMQSSSAAQQSSSSTSSSNETVPGKVDDSWITTKVKSKFAAAKGVKSSDISVSTTDGAVTLTGSVASSKQKMRVEHLAKQVKGVKSVDGSGLTVNSASSTSTPASSSSASGH
jgi:hyperosmotically inducible periplasmic protein